MHHVLQIYCPLKNSPYHRVLYIFTCINRPCWSTPHSWKVMRCQLMDADSVNSDGVARQTENKMADSGGASGDCGGGSQGGEVQWCDDADDWGDEDTDDVMGEQGNQTDTSNNLTKNTVSDTSATETQDITKNHNISKPQDITKNQNISKPQDLTENQNMSETQDITETQDIVIDQCVQNYDMAEIDSCNFNEMNIHDPEESPTDNTHGNIVTSEGFPASEESVNNMLGILATSSDPLPSPLSGSKQSDYLLPYFLSVIDEPTNEEVRVDTHVTKLLKAYIQKTGEDVDFIADEQTLDKKSRRGGGSGSWNERYEKTEVKHGDRCFHRFLKQLSLCPHQLVRYDLHGSPLLVREAAPGFDLPRCVTCGGPMTFELQLVPPLISLLRLPHTADAVTEFGTVLVYTCEKSCWSDEVKVRQEVAFVQPDPDQHLFKLGL
ncbi:programmed cell death protein 2-like isoform X2 [Gigantopelta aegis]|nr:programmed cell death protein 2-like isoform X2 [Gigantopelta aegis]